MLTNFSPLYFQFALTLNHHFWALILMKVEQIGIFKLLLAPLTFNFLFILQFFHQSLFGLPGIFIIRVIFFIFTVFLHKLRLVRIVKPMTSIVPGILDLIICRCLLLFESSCGSGYLREVFRVNVSFQFYTGYLSFLF